MATQESTNNAQLYDAHEARMAALDMKRDGMEECKAIYVEAGMKNLTIWTALSGSVAWYCHKNSTRRASSARDGLPCRCSLLTVFPLHPHTLRNRTKVSTPTGAQFYRGWSVFLCRFTIGTKAYFPDAIFERLTQLKLRNN